MRLHVPRSVPVAGLLIGFPGLLRALLMLDTDPLLAVLGLLAAMTVLFASVACLCGNENENPLHGLEDRRNV